MAELKETHVVKTQRGGGATPWLAFFVGALLVAVIAIFLMNARGHVETPAGSLDLNINSPVKTAPANPAPVTPPGAK